MESWAPWDYIISYIGITAIALFFMQAAHRRAMAQLTAVYDRGLADQKQMIIALQSVVAILEEILRREREKNKS